MKITGVNVPKISLDLKILLEFRIIGRSFLIQIGQNEAMK